MSEFSPFNMSLLTVYKASAGSGKTWRLTMEYLKFLMQRPDVYRNMLAVTFTNKATGEMKKRILNALWELSTIDSENPEGLVITLVDETGLQPEAIREKARLSLRLILHDYGRFRVETIDSFFQSILRNLARELGIGTSMNIELNDAAVLDEAVDAMLDRSSEDPSLLSWITDFMEEAYLEGKNWKIDRTLREFGMTIFKEFFKEKSALLKDKLSDKTFLQAYKKELQAYQAQREDKIKKAADVFFNTLQQNNLNIDDLSNKAGGVSGFFLKLKKGDCDSSLVGSRVREAMSDPEKWASKTHLRRNEIINLASSTLIPLLNETEALRKKVSPSIITCRLCIRHLSSVGLLTDISREVSELNEINNRFLLSDTIALLQSLISGQDTSFVFEKTGTEIDHILFDEFQDTSRMQWETFKPLLAESLSNGHESLVVGDEKQAIYRWRNGDWRILGNISNDMTETTVEEKVLSNNWRSDKLVVAFNNRLFTEIAGLVSQHLSDAFQEPATDIEKAYKEVVQDIVRTENPGYVNLIFEKASDDNTYNDLMLHQLLEQTEIIQQQGIRPDQMAILVRVNKQIPVIATWFASHKNAKLEEEGVCYDIISDEAFLLSSSKVLQMLVNALRLLADPQNALLEAQLRLDFQLEVLQREPDLHRLLTEDDPNQAPLPEAFTNNLGILRQTPLHELAETLYQVFDLSQIPDQDSYLYTFMDKLNEYLGHHPSDLPSFLEYWDESLSTVSVPSGSGVNGIRILSVHKAKGLEYHTVLIPFCDWKLVEEHHSRLWCEPHQKPFDQLSLLPVNYCKALKESIFSEEYKIETIQQYLDNINLLYVAFTRAKSNLIVIGKGREEKKDNGQSKLINVSDLMLEAFKNESFFGHGMEENKTCCIGNLQTDKKRPDKQPEKGLIRQGTDLPVSFCSYGQKAHFRQSNRSKEFSLGIDPEGFHNSYIDRGKLYHKLFSDIRTIEDIPDAVRNLSYEGLINNEEAKECEAFARKALENPQVSDWFSGRYRLFNECSILDQDAEGHTVLKRPDRVMLGQDVITVVDFKFGKPSTAYRRQVQEYMRLLKAMNYPLVKGYLWYVDVQNVEGVTLP